MADVPFTVQYYNNPASPIDISAYINSVSMKLQGSGRIRTASIMFDADYGKFITNSNSGTTPKLAGFDKLKITFDDGSATKEGYFLLDENLKQLTVQGKYLLPIEMLAQERALQDIKTQAFYQFKTPQFVILDLLNRYNSYAKGTAQPAIILEGFDGPALDSKLKTVVNTYDFSAGFTFFDAIMHVINRLNQPTAFGGLSDFYSITFEDFNHEIIIMRIFAQGTTDGAVPVLNSTETFPFHKVTTQIKTPEGTQVLVFGMQNISSMPPDLHRYTSWVETINNYPKYNPTAVYAEGIRINSNGTVYEAVQEVPLATPPPNVTYWVTRSPQQIIGVLDYSPWTKDKDLVTKNSCSNPDNAFLVDNFDAPAFPDGNLVIRDRYNPSTGIYRFFRDWAWMRATSPESIQADARKRRWLMTDGVTYFFYNGFTVLVNGIGTGGFSGTDRFGRSYSNAIVFYDGDEWIVIRNPEVGDQCAVYTEGRIYEWNYDPAEINRMAFGNGHNQPPFAPKFRNSSGTFAWQDISETAGGCDCFHRPKSITNVDGLIAKNINGLDYTSYVRDSAIKVVYEYAPLEAAWDQIHGFFDKLYQGAVKFGENLANGRINDDYTFEEDEIDRTLLSEFYNYGWWYALPFPYPFSNFNSITEAVGDLYGGGPATFDTFAALDIMNANYTHSGLTGYNNDESGDLGGPFTGLKFWFLFDILINGGRQPFQGNLPFTVTVYDDLRQVWRADFNYSLLGNPMEVNLPFSQFTVNRPSRTPYQIDSLANIINNVIVPELEIRSIFEQRRVRLITIQFAQAYDEFMRYTPFSIDRLIRSIGGLATVSFEGTIDGLGLTKQAFVTSGEELTRVINSKNVEAPNVRNLLQLESIALAEQDIVSFPFEQFIVETDGKCNYQLEQSIYLREPYLIDEEDRVGTPNTRKLVLMGNQLSYDTQRGFYRTLTLTRRLEAEA